MRKLHYTIQMQHFTAYKTLNGSNHEYKTVFNKYLLSYNEFSQNCYFIWLRLVCKNKNQKDQALCNLFSVNALRTLNSDPFRPQDIATATRRELEQLTRLRLAVQESTDDSTLYKPYYMVDLRPWSKRILLERILHEIGGTEMLIVIKTWFYLELYEQTAIHASMAIDTGANERFWSKPFSY